MPSSTWSHWTPNVSQSTPTLRHVRGLTRPVGRSKPTESDRCAALFFGASAARLEGAESCRAHATCLCQLGHLRDVRRAPVRPAATRREARGGHLLVDLVGDPVDPAVA